MCAVCNLADPVGRVIDGGLLDSGLALRLERHRVPLGVVGVIYGARPVLPLMWLLCLKTGQCGDSTLWEKRRIARCRNRSCHSEGAENVYRKRQFRRLIIRTVRGQ